MKDPEDKKGAIPEKKSGVTPGDKERERYGREGPGTITEVAPDAQRAGGPIKEMAPDVGRVRPEVAPDVRGRPIQEMAPDVGRGIHPEVAPDLGRGGIHPEVAPELGGHSGSVHLMYAPTIQDAIARGDLARMREVARQAEQQLATAGDLRTSLEILKIEIARLEHKQTRK